MAWRLAFFVLLGVTGLLKGIGFGGALVLAATALVLLWDRDRPTARALLWPAGMILAAVVALAWPWMVLPRHPEAIEVWALHVTDRLAANPEHFAGERLGDYMLAPLWQTLPWTPLALVGAWRSWGRARRERLGPDRLLWAWAVGPAALVSLASVKNAHYLIHALPPWSIWSALTLARLGERLQARGWPPAAIRRVAVVLFGGLALAWGLGFALMGRRFHPREAEWAFYQQVVRRAVPPDEPLVFLYDDWDKAPYPTPSGPLPADWPARLFYLDRPASWRRGVPALTEDFSTPSSRPFAVVARGRDVEELRRLGEVEWIAEGPTTRVDRSYGLYRITPGEGNSRGRIPDSKGQMADDE